MKYLANHENERINVEKYNCKLYWTKKNSGSGKKITY